MSFELLNDSHSNLDLQGCIKTCLKIKSWNKHCKFNLIMGFFNLSKKVDLDKCAILVREELFLRIKIINVKELALSKTFIISLVYEVINT